MRETAMQTPRSVRKEREEVRGSGDSPAARGGPHAAAGGWAQKRPRLWESPRWSSLWRTAACGKDSCWRSSWRADPRGRDPTLEQGKSVRSPPREESSPQGGRSGRDNVGRTDRNPHSHPPALLWGEEVEEESGPKLSLGRREGWGEGVFLRYGSISHYPTLI